MTSPDAVAAPPAWQSLRAELVRFVRSRVADEAASDDIVHDVLLRALGELEGPRPPLHLRAWLYRVTRHAIVDHYRRRRPDEPLPEEIAGTEAGTDEAAEQELARCLTPLLAGLPAPYREALTLAEVEGVAQREIARREGISLSGAKSRVQRARRMLRQAILGCCRVEVDRRGGVLDFQRQTGCGPGGGPRQGDRPCAPSGDGPGCRAES